MLVRHVEDERDTARRRAEDLRALLDRVLAEVEDLPPDLREAITKISAASKARSFVQSARGVDQRVDNRLLGDIHTTAGLGQHQPPVLVADGVEIPKRNHHAAELNQFCEQIGYPYFGRDGHRPAVRVVPHSSREGGGS